MVSRLVSAPIAGGPADWPRLARSSPWPGGSCQVGTVERLDADAAQGGGPTDVGWRDDAHQPVAVHDQRPAVDAAAEADEQFVRVGDEWGQALVLFVEMELHGVAGRMP